VEPYWFGRDEGEALWMFDVLNTIKAGAEQIAIASPLWDASPCWWRRLIANRANHLGP
jgi:hypothetical protein